VEAFDFPVGLRASGPGELRFDAEVVADVTPGVGAVGGAVVGQDALDGDAVSSEPGHGSLQDADRGFGFLVVVDLGVGDSGVIVDDGVHERVSSGHIACDAATAGAQRGGRPVAHALRWADESSLLDPQMHDLLHHRLRCLVRMPMRSRRPIGHPFRAELDIPSRPLRRCVPRHPVVVRRSRHRPVVIDDEAGKTKTLDRGQRRITVRHENLLGSRAKN
jgi:hypothetical protein